ncbi:DNA recombination protein RmuC [Paenacidovorax caeni]|uniref:DNA recombination protein RmuC n=1 Tax=Paenacidovorax caeni TaxID=343013 RepID=A0A1I7HHR9_9BURK|nr:DNA recombination protein RmuC [Paenacidovorax caeni]SFU60099.1 DNA recombination protein RmuC [Paenacidovorax caeni]
MMPFSMAFGAAALCAAVALLLGWLAGAARARGAAQAAAVQAQAQREASLAQLAQAGAQLAAAQERVRGLEAERLALLAELQQGRGELQMAQEHTSQLQTQLAAQATQLEAERRAAHDKLALLAEAREALSHQFKSLANDILEEKSRRFAEQNQLSLGQLLDPLRSRLADFQGRVEQFYDAEGKQRSALAQQVHQLMQLNQTLSEDAKNLTQALKGSTKAQGNWGELILERVLESAGLRKGFEYDVQENHLRADGSRAQPDVVIHLPENRHLVIDAKASLLAYEEWAHADDEAVRAGAQRRHLDSVRQHIKGLAERNYQQLYALQSLDFVLMFVPIEPAFMLAVTADNQLYSDAWNRNVLLVSPSTLLFVLRTVAHLWRQEAQTRNAQEIAQRGADLYDHLTAFVEELEKVGKNLGQAQDAYQKAFNKLSKNRGNVIRRAEMLKELGIKPAKALPPALVEAARGEGPED